MVYKNIAELSIWFYIAIILLCYLHNLIEQSLLPINKLCILYKVFYVWLLCVPSQHNYMSISYSFEQ